MHLNRMFVFLVRKKCVCVRFSSLSLLVVDVVCFIVKMTVLNILLPCQFEPFQRKLTNCHIHGIRMEWNDSFWSKSFRIRMEYLECAVHSMPSIGRFEFGMMNSIWNMNFWCCDVKFRNRLDSIRLVDFMLLEKCISIHFPKLEHGHRDEDNWCENRFLSPFFEIFDLHRRVINNEDPT